NEYPVITAAEIKMSGNDLTKTLHSLGIKLSDDVPTDHQLYKANEISVLLGNDVYWKIVTGKIERINEALDAVETRLGWCIQSSVMSFDLRSMTVSSNLCLDEELSNNIKSFWEIESLGIALVLDEKEDIKALSLFEQSIRKRDGRYEEEIIEKSENNTFNSKKTYYVPHRAVIREDHSTTKLCVVYDASTREKGHHSLNDCLLPGPNLVPDLLIVLLNFRKGEIAAIADIQKAFLQISIAPEDRDALRFLWISEDAKFPNTKFEIYRMTRVMFGATSSPFLLAATMRHHLKKFQNIYPMTTKLLNSCMYVDDLVYSTNSVEEASQVQEEATLIFKQASMNLVKWKSNSRILNNKIYGSEVQADGSEEVLEEVKVLGL
ncbi:uncharacterized protein, partial [Parasteatoda tepidariorum]|uniref:uncharacterized protein n=1 Tax=Parasteatoda tepidariorum TaxID=114398 RepID=UPI001C7228BF